MLLEVRVNDHALELMILVSWNWVILVRQMLTFRNVSALLLDYWIEQLLFDVKFVFWTRILYMKVPAVANVCLCGVWNYGLTTYLMFVSRFFRNLVFNNSWSVSLTNSKRFWHCLFYSVYIFIEIQLYIISICLVSTPQIRLNCCQVLLYCYFPWTQHWLSLCLINIRLGQNWGKLQTIHLGAVLATNFFLFLFQ